VLTDRVQQNTLLFVGGIYGSGKTSICARVSEKLGGQHLKASELAQHKVRGVADQGKAVDSVQANQQTLLENLARTRRDASLSVLDGHYCIYNRLLQIEEIALPVFECIRPDLLLIVDIEPNIALERLVQRERATFDLERLTELRARESSHATLVSNHLRVPLLIVRFDLAIEELLKSISNHLNS
jgi:adenylate kinase